MKNNRKLKQFVYVLGVLFLWGAISVSIVLQNKSYLDLDEIGFVNTGNLLFKTFFVERDFDSDVWSNVYNNYGTSNPRVGLYILGGMNSLIDVIAYHFSLEKGVAIVIFRCVNSLFASFGVFFIYLFLRKLSGAKVALVAVLLLLINPVFRSITDALTPDIHMFCFLSLSLYLMYDFCESIKKNVHSYSKLVMLSLSMGLAISTRIYGVYICFVFFLIWFENFKRQFLKRNFLDLFLCCSIMFLVFYLSNPFLYNNFLLGVREMTTLHISRLSSHEIVFHFSQSEFLFTYPYLLFRAEPFSIDLINKQTTIGLSDYRFFVLVYIVVLKGIVMCIRRKKYLPIYLFICSHLWIYYPLLALRLQVLTPKTFLVPALSVIFLFSLGCFSMKTAFSIPSEKEQ